MISFKFKFAPVHINVKPLTSPYYGKGLFLGLAVSPLHFSEVSALTQLPVKEIKEEL